MKDVAELRVHRLARERHRALQVELLRDRRRGLAASSVVTKSFV